MKISDAPAISKARRLGKSGRARHIRLKAGIGLRELAEMIQVSPASLSRWERGQNPPRSRAAIRWSQALDLLALNGSRDEQVEEVKPPE